MKLKLLAVLVLLLVIWGSYKNSERNVTEIDQSKEEFLNNEEGGGEDLKFSVMADVHSKFDNWKELLKVAKERGGGFVILAGDLVTEGRKSEFMEAKRVLDESEVEYYVIPGNYDWRWGESKGRNEYGEVFGSDYFSFKKGGVKFLMINNGGYLGLGEKQWEWLRSEVGECQEYFCIGVMHMPLNHNFLTDVMGRENQKLKSEASELLMVLRDGGVKDIITGHMHYSTSYEIEGIRTYIVGAVGEHKNPQGSRYTEFEIRNNKLYRQVVTLEAGE